jgi:hypothetical protein
VRRTFARTMPLSRREFLHRVTASAAGSGLVAGALPAGERSAAAPDTGEPFFVTRGAVLVVRDLESYDWPALARSTGLTTLATHIRPTEIAGFVTTDAGQRFLEACRKHGLAVEHELHALADLLPRELFGKDQTMFRMDDQGARVRDHNLCVHSQPALDVAAENAERYTRLLRSTTGRYFYWIDDGMPMCRCPKCRAYSDSDQALIFENHILEAIRHVDARAQLAHLAYANTLEPPKQVRPAPGIFLEFAPIERRYDVPLGRRDARSATRDLQHGRLLDALDANLEWFGREGAQALEYWLDVSRFSGWKRDQTVEIPWNDTVFRDDLATYARRGIRHVTTFAAWLDGDYARRWGVAPVRAYGAGLARWRWTAGAAKEQT